MKVLFAVNNEKISEAIMKRYQKDYKEIISGKNVYYFNAILKELQKDKSYDRIIISEDLEPFANNNYEAIDKFIYDKLDTISDEAFNSDGTSIPIVLIGTDRRTKPDPLLAKIFGIGVYDTLIGKDRSVEKVCELLNRPRSKKEAKIYYKIGNDNFEYKREKEEIVSEDEIQSILTHYKKIGKNEEKYVESFNSIVEQYTDEQLKVIISFLPKGVTNVLSKESDKYNKLVGTSNETIGKENTKGKKKGEEKGKEQPIEFIEKELSKQKLTKPVIIPTSVDTSKVKKIEESEEQKNEEELKRKQEEKKKQAELRKKQEEKKKQAELKRKQEEEKKQAELKRKQEEEKRQVELKRKQKEEEKKQAELKRKQEEEKRQAELKRKQEEEKRQAELKRKQEEEKKQAELKRKQEEEKQEKKKRGRPVKEELDDDDDDDDDDLPNVDKIAADEPGRRRGRPAKNKEKIKEEEKIKDEEKKETEDEDIFLGFENIEENENEEDILSTFELEEDEEENIEELEDEEDIEEFEDLEDEEEDEDILPGFEDEEDEEDDEVDEKIEDEEDVEEFEDLEDEEEDEDILPGFEDEDDEEDNEEDEEIEDEEDIEGVEEIEDEDEEEDIEEFEDLEDEEEDEDILPGFEDEDDEEDNEEVEEIEDEDEEDIEEFEDLEDEEEDEDILPGFDDEEDIEEFEDLEDEEEDEDILPGFEDEDEDDEEDIEEDEEVEDEDEDIEEFEDLEDEEEDEDILPGFEDEDDEEDIEEVEEIEDLEDEDDDEDEIDKLLEQLDEESDEDSAKISNPNFVRMNPISAQKMEETNNSKEIENINKVNTSVNFDIDSLISSNKKIVAFVGTSKNGTSFLVNNLAALLSDRGIKTAILDLTKNRNSYYIYTDNQEERRITASKCIQGLKDGNAQGITINRNLDVYTTLPDELDELDDVNEIIPTLLNNYSLVLLDCDFETKYQYFNIVQEIYLVQSLDILTIQPLTAFLRELKAKGILEQNKLRVVINKYIKLKQITEKAVIGGMSVYNDPSMSFMTDLFNVNSVKSILIPFEQQTYAKYLNSLFDGKISLKGYSKSLIQSLNKLGDMVFPLINTGKKNKNMNNNFSTGTNNTLNKMKNKY